jgi:hypothetical protein
VAKLDLIEARGRIRPRPVDYKRGRPRENHDGTLGAWKPERVQLCLQALVLRENGFQCDHGVIYYHGTRQRVVVPIDDAADRRVLEPPCCRPGRWPNCLGPPRRWSPAPSALEMLAVGHLPARRNQPLPSARGAD